MENNYQLSRIHNYVNGLMNPEEMYALEKEALADPFLQDAIDGYRMQQGVDVKQLSLLQQRFNARIAENNISKNKRFYSWQRLAIGMTAAVMFVTVSTLLLIRYLPSSNPSNLHEVELMQDQVFTVSLANTGASDGEPVAGWQAFEDYLTANYTGHRHTEGDVLIRFSISSEGLPKDFVLNDGKGNANADTYKELLNLIQRGGKWQGQEAEIRVNLHEMKIKN